MRVSFDTNVPVYALVDLSLQERTNAARNLLRRLAESGNCFVSVQVLKEFANVAIRKSVPSMAEDEVAAHLRTLCVFDIFDVASDVVFKAVHRSYESRISFYDSLIVEAAIAGGAEILYSEDLQHGMQFDSLRVINPFL